MDDAAVVMRNGATELSVRYHSTRKQWVAIQGKPQFGDEVIARTASNLSGPWSEARAIFHYPEMAKNRPRYDHDTFCYAAKEQAQFRKPSGDILITYACNSFDFGKQIANMGLYKPRAVLLKLPE